MNIPEGNKCQQTMEALINNEVKQELQLHIGNCENCRQMAETVTALQKFGSAFDPTENLNLKKRVINRLLPVIKQPSARGEPRTQLFSWRYILAAAMAVVALFSISQFKQKDLPQTDNLSKLPIIAKGDPATFDISVNGKSPVKVSMDNPISLFSNETALVSLADGSSISVSGPARMTVQPRGFHLLSGKATATVIPGSGQFAATTIHGRIEVLGTVFTCETSPSRTVVSVQRGKVRVADNNGDTKILEAGDKTEIGQETSVNSTEVIPLISRE